MYYFTFWTFAGLHLKTDKNLFWLFKAGGPCLKTLHLEDKSKTSRCLLYQFYKQLAKLDNKFNVYICPVSLFSSTAPSSALLLTFLTAKTIHYCFTILTVPAFLVQLPYLQTLLLHSTLKWAAKISPEHLQPFPVISASSKSFVLTYSIQ